MRIHFVSEQYTVLGFCKRAENLWKWLKSKVTLPPLFSFTCCLSSLLSCCWNLLREVFPPREAITVAGLSRLVTPAVFSVFCLVLVWLVVKVSGLDRVKPWFIPSSGLKLAGTASFGKSLASKSLILEQSWRVRRWKPTCFIPPLPPHTLFPLFFPLYFSFGPTVTISFVTLVTRMVAPGDNGLEVIAVDGGDDFWLCQNR